MSIILVIPLLKPLQTCLKGNLRLQSVQIEGFFSIKLFSSRKNRTLKAVPLYYYITRKRKELAVYSEVKLFHKCGLLNFRLSWFMYISLEQKTHIYQFATEHTCIPVLNRTHTYTNSEHTRTPVCNRRQIYTSSQQKTHTSTTVFLGSISKKNQPSYF